MSSLTVYDAVIPVFIKGLKTFDHILNKAEEHAKANNVDANTYPEARLVEDQLPLTFQVQNATKTVKTNIARLTGVELEPFENKEKTIEDLHKRIQEALDLLSKVDAAAVNAKADNEVDLPIFGGKVLKVTAKEAALSHGVPNFFFHLNAGYAILRSKGVPVGKADYLGSFLGQ
ncbi:helix-turn-helix-domain containing protein type [Colletotrichum tofieldiae]|nr:helix-turn-helix-domain containing protein type [Colletotrichum tofieldiae]GKT80341.1 helix-turn-helix-domain containing protein type [Colletotrichum tofieldiae]